MDESDLKLTEILIKATKHLLKENIILDPLDPWFRSVFDDRLIQMKPGKKNYSRNTAVTNTSPEKKARSAKSLQWELTKDEWISLMKDARGNWLPTKNMSIDKEGWEVKLPNNPLVDYLFLYIAKNGFVHAGYKSKVVGGSPSSIFSRTMWEEQFDTEEDAKKQLYPTMGWLVTFEPKFERPEIDKEEEVIIKKDLILELLKKHELTVTFKKLNGKNRVMKCSLKENILPPKGTANIRGESLNKSDNPDVVAVWDIENNGWRSFRLDSLIKLEYHQKILGKDLDFTYILEKDE